MKRPWVRTALIICTLTLVALTACSRERSGDVHNGEGSADAISVTLHDDAFAPEVLRLKAGTEVEVEVRNDGSNQHNFTIDDLDLSTGTVEPGNVVTASFTVPNGTTGYHCTFHPDMTGDIVAG